MLLLAACAGRPGPEVLVPVTAALPEGAAEVAVLVATDRTPRSGGRLGFGSGRAEGMSYGRYQIAFPPDHAPGDIDWPGETPDPGQDVVVTAHEPLDRAGFAARIADSGLAPVLFVHGFNTSYQEALFRLAQITADAEPNNVPVLFAWPSEGSPLGYAADRDAATFARDDLMDLLVLLAADTPAGPDGRPRPVTVFAHSMGGWLVAEALRGLRLAGADATLAQLDVILAAPDIDTDVFRAQMQAIGPMARPMVILVASDDRALSLSSTIARERPRIGALDPGDPEVRRAAEDYNLAVVDISALAPHTAFRHDRYIALAGLYPRLAAARAELVEEQGLGLLGAGTFVLNAVSGLLIAPFIPEAPDDDR